MSQNLVLTVVPITRDEHMIAPAVASKIRHATQTIIARGAYTNPDGVEISIAALQDQAKAQQRAYSATQPIESIQGRYSQTQVYVYNQTVLTIARERVRQGYRVAMLHFVMPTARAQVNISRPTQSDSLMRSSSLAHCIENESWPMTSPFYDDRVVVTPQVPVFRDHSGDLLAAPWQGGMVHALAVDAHEVRRQMPEREAEVPQVMIARAQRVLLAAATMRANVLVLGAWGCGTAGLDASLMAAIWQVAITQANVRMIGIIDFAIADVKPSRPTFASFYQRLHQQHITHT